MSCMSCVMQPGTFVLATWACESCVASMSDTLTCTRTQVGLSPERRWEHRLLTAGITTTTLSRRPLQAPRRIRPQRRKLRRSTGRSRQQCRCRSPVQIPDPATEPCSTFFRHGGTAARRVSPLTRKRKAHFTWRLPGVRTPKRGASQLPPPPRSPRACPRAA
jgi:hypothetical protein